MHYYFIICGLFFFDICCTHFFEQPIIQSLLCLFIIRLFSSISFINLLMHALLLAFENILFYFPVKIALTLVISQIVWIPPLTALLNRENKIIYLGLLLLSLFSKYLVMLLLLKRPIQISYTVAEISVNMILMIFFLKYMQKEGKLGNRLY